jgi:hypothetical protein
MSEQLDAILRQMQELTTTVREHRFDPATLDFEQVKGLFGEQIGALVEAQVKEQMSRQPVRRVPGDPVQAGLEEAAGLVKAGNRYFGHVKEFAARGYSKEMGQIVKPIDLWIAQRILDGQVLARGKGFIDGAAPVPASEDLRAAVKALTSTGSTTGDELVPTGMASELWQDFFLASRIVANMTRVPMPTNPFDIPLGLGDVTWRKGSENTATTASDPATAKSTLTATELVTEQNWSYTLNEDAVVAMAPTIRERLAISGGEIIDAFALNADGTDENTGNINLDDANPTDTNYYLSAGQDGIRHQWIRDNTAMTVNAGGDALSDSDIVSALALMGKYAVAPSQVRMVCDVSTYLKGLLNLDAVLTIDKFGPDAVVATGQLAAYRGIPIIVSESHELAEDDGCLSTTAESNTLGSISFFNRMMWYVGFLRDLLIEVDRDIQKRQYIMVSSLREAVAARGTRSSNTHTAGIRNILVA